MARHVRAHASNADETDIHVRCLMFDIRFEAADFRPAARIAVNSLASLSSKEIFGPGINSPSRINSSQYKLSSASVPCVTLFRRRMDCALFLHPQWSWDRDLDK